MKSENKSLPNVDEKKKKKKKKKKSYKSLMKSYLKSSYTDEEKLENHKKKLDNILVNANFKKVDII
tara:strand:- start:91 stop:288 length:198 start_codon:yes stop_codon:yes gene_type:complete